jgi:hypothetical protein
MRLSTRDDDGGKQTGQRQCAQGRGKEADAVEEPADKDVNQAQQKKRAVHGGKKERQKIGSVSV